MEFITVHTFVEQILADLPKPYEADLIDRVFQAIESNPERLETYQQLVLAHGRFPVENSIAFNVQGLAGMKSLERVRPARSTLIENYTELGT